MPWKPTEARNRAMMLFSSAKSSLTIYFGFRVDRENVTSENYVEASFEHQSEHLLRQGICDLPKGHQRD